MSRVPTFWRTLREQRIPVLAWGVALAALGFVHVIMFPEYRDAASALAENSYYQGLAGAAGGLGTPSGYLNAEYFTGAPLLVLIFAIIAGTGVMASEATSGTLDLVLAQPVRRSRVLLEKYVALAVLGIVVSLASLPGLLLGQMVVDFELGMSRLIAACLTIVPIAWLYTAIAVFGGSVLRSRVAASVIVIGAALAGFFLNAFGTFVDALEVPRKLSPFYWTDYGKALTGASDWVPLVVLMAITATIVTLTAALFERRDLGMTAAGQRWWRGIGTTGASRAQSAPDESRMAGLATFLRTIREQRVQFGAWGVTVLVLAFVTVVIYPQFRETLAAFDDSGAFGELAGEAGSISSPAGYLSLEFFSYIPLLILIAAVIAGTGTIAGEESSGTLDLVLAQPVSRRRIILEKAAGLVLLTVAVSLVAVPGLVIAALIVDIDISLLRLALAAVYIIPLVLLFLSMAILAGAALADRTVATILVVGLAIAGYFLNTLGAYVSSLDQARKLSPFFWADFSRIMLYGFDYGRAAVFLGIAALLLAAAVLLFERRDIATHAITFRLPRRERP